MRTLLERWWFWAAAVLLAAGMVVSGVLVSAGRSRATQANFDRIQEGMTLYEVIEILGEVKILGEGRARDYLHAYERDSRVAYVGCWWNGPDKIHVWFGDNRKVEGKEFTRGTAWERFKHPFRMCLPEAWQ
jgi:hypothetical protein